MICTNKKQYSIQWESESEQIESQGLYEKLSQLIPNGNVLEFGCGTGKGTKYLLDGRNVLSLDSNVHLIQLAYKYLRGLNLEPNIHQCDFFTLSPEDKKIIADFEPKIIVGWFIGSCGQDIVKHTKEQPSPNEKGKLYREKIEDIIVSKDICLPSVEYIHFVTRGAIANSISKEEFFDSQKADYEKHVFDRIGFEVVSVNTIPWSLEGSKFQYVQAKNPNFIGGSVTPSVVSILAKRIQS